MAMEKYNFLKEEVFGLRHQMTFIGNEMKIYIPKYFVEEDSVFGRVLGNKIECLGIFWFSVNNKFYELLLPIKIQFEYHEEDTFKGKLKPELISEEYNVYILKKGDAFCYDLNHLKDIEDIETLLLKVIDNGKIPATVNYNDVLKLIMNLLLSTGYNTKLGVSSAVYEILLSELYRNRFNISEPFRKLITTSKTATLYDFKERRLQNLPGLNSIFGSLLGEDSIKQLSNIIVRQREGMKDRVSPLERLLKY